MTGFYSERNTGLKEDKVKNRKQRFSKKIFVITINDTLQVKINP